MSATAVSAQIVNKTNRPSERKFRKAVKTIMYRTNGHDLTPKRLQAMDIVQSEINYFEREDWKEYRMESDPKVLAEMESKGVPYFLRQAFNKVNEEIRTTKVAEGTVAVWLLYNMGYIVKTPTTTFAIDLYSRYTDELLDVIDFGMITHPHSDHNHKAFTQGLAKRNKPILAAFDIKNVEEMRVEDGGVYTFGDVKVRVTLGDHNKKLLNYVASYEIDCGENTNNTVIFHTGDSCNYEQLNPEKHVDIFIPHMRVNLKIQAAIDKFRPHHVFLSHLQELGHRVTKWRWTFDDALKDKAKFQHDHLWIPCWGERIIYNRNDWK
jgi:hypothetical protein